MPQPLSAITDNISYSFGTTPISSRPELLALTMQIIAGWSATESQLGSVFATLLGSKKFVTVEMYAAFESFAVQKQMLIAAARTILPKSYFRVLELTLQAVSSSAEHRHNFAHCILGVSHDSKLTDALLLIQPQEQWRVRARKMRHWRRSEKWTNQLNAIIKTPNLDPKKIQVYKKSELERIAAEIEQAYEYAHALMLMVQPRPRKGRSRTRPVYDWLCKQPPIQTALSEDRRQRKELHAKQRERTRKRKIQGQQKQHRRDLKRAYKKGS